MSIAPDVTADASNASCGASASRTLAAAASPSLMARVRGSAYIWLPLLILAVLGAPRIPFLLPAAGDVSDEIYQPIQALEFFRSKGQAFHKYGPMGNFLLAPAYGLSLGYWYLTGEFSKPESDYPYGFQRPLEQLGALVWQSRVLFLALGLIGFGVLARELGRHVNSKLAVALAILTCVVGNYLVVWSLPAARPDAALLAFQALALAAYVRILYDGLTPRRAFWLAAAVACAATGKEIAAPLFALPGLAIVIDGWLRSRGSPEARRQYWRSIGVAVATTVVVYVGLNVWYAPATWLRRMEWYFTGPGVDGEVWSKDGSGSAFLSNMKQALFVNLGPGGVLLIPLAIAALLVRRPPRWLMLLLPSLSLVPVLLKIGYAPERFYMPMITALAPAVAVGLGVLLGAWKRTPAAEPDDASSRATRSVNPVLASVLIFLAMANVALAGLTWFRLYHHRQAAIERHVRANLPQGTKVGFFAWYPRTEEASRLGQWGYLVEERPIQQWRRADPTLPEYVYVVEAKSQFIEDARGNPARARMLLKSAKFNVADWHGMAAVGYAPVDRFGPSLPRFVPARYLPRALVQRDGVVVYRRVSGATPATAPAPAAPRGS